MIIWWSTASRVLFARTKQMQIFVAVEKATNCGIATSKNTKYRGSIAAKIGNIAAVSQ
jgi:hypothetical protein